jgi:hypothetical protein
MKYLAALFGVLLLVGGAYQPANAAETITLNQSSSFFCFGSGNGTSIAVTTTNNCGQSNISTITGSASSASTTGTYSLLALASPAFSLTSPTSCGPSKTCFTVLPNGPQFTFTYKNGGTTLLQGGFSFTSFSQTYPGPGGNPITTATAQFTYASGTLGPAAGIANLNFDFGGGESLLTLFNTSSGGGQGNWNGISSKSLMGALPLTVVPEPTTWALMLTGFFGMGALLRHRRRTAAAA